MGALLVLMEDRSRIPIAIGTGDRRPETEDRRPEPVDRRPETGAGSR